MNDKTYKINCKIIKQFPQKIIYKNTFTVISMQYCRHNCICNFKYPLRFTHQYWKENIFLYLFSHKFYIIPFFLSSISSQLQFYLSFLLIFFAPNYFEQIFSKHIWSRPNVIRIVVLKLIIKLWINFLLFFVIIFLHLCVCELLFAVFLLLFYIYH